MFKRQEKERKRNKLTLSKKKELHTRFSIIFHCNGNDGVDGNNECDGDSEVKSEWKGGCNNGNCDDDWEGNCSNDGDCDLDGKRGDVRDSDWDKDCEGDCNVDSDSACDNEHNVKDVGHSGGDGVGCSFKDSDGKDASAVDCNVQCNGDCDGDWEGAWDVDGQRDSDGNWEVECNGDWEANCDDDWEGNLESNWEGKCNNGNKWDGGWGSEGDNDDHSGSNGVGCGLIDSDGKDVSAI